MVIRCSCSLRVIELLEDHFCPFFNVDNGLEDNSGVHDHFSWNRVRLEKRMGPAYGHTEIQQLHKWNRSTRDSQVLKTVVQNGILCHNLSRISFHDISIFEDNLPCDISVYSKSPLISIVRQ
jgi:hypothetical protein